jgi:hypothetical protein
MKRKIIMTLKKINQIQHYLNLKFYSLLINLLKNLTAITRLIYIQKIKKLYIIEKLSIRKFSNFLQIIY